MSGIKNTNVWRMINMNNQYLTSYLWIIPFLCKYSRAQTISAE